MPSIKFIDYFCFSSRHLVAIVCLATATACLPISKEKVVPGGWQKQRALGATVSSPNTQNYTEVEKNAPIVRQEPTGNLTLREALAQALLNNPRLKTFAWEVRAGDAAILQASLKPNPELEVEFDNFLGSGERRGFVGAETTLAISQLIELHDKRRKRIRVAKLERDLAGWDYESNRMNVYVETAKAFVATVAAQQRVNLKREQLNLATKTIETVTERVNAGREAVVERTKAAVELASQKIELNSAVRNLEASRDRLAATWGGTTALFSKVDGSLASFPILPPRIELLKLLPDNPQIARSGQSTELHRSRLDLEKARNKPDVTVSAGIRRFQETDDNAFVAGFSVPIPIYGVNTGGVLEAERRLAQERQRQRALLVEVTSTLNQTYREASALQSELTSLTEEILPGAMKAHEGAQQGYREGKFDFLAVLDAQRTLFAARERFIETAAAYHNSALEIERLTGQPLSSSLKRK